MKKVSIRWRDTSGGFLSGWRPISSMVPKHAICTATGVIVNEVDDILVVCPHISHLDGEIYGDGEIYIFKPNIILPRRRRLK